MSNINDIIKIGYVYKVEDINEKGIYCYMNDNSKSEEVIDGVKSINEGNILYIPKELLLNGDYQIIRTIK